MGSIVSKHRYGLCSLVLPIFPGRTGHQDQRHVTKIGAGTRSLHRREAEAISMDERAGRRAYRARSKEAWDGTRGAPTSQTWAEAGSIRGAGGLGIEPRQEEIFRRKE